MAPDAPGAAEFNSVRRGVADLEANNGVAFRGGSNVSFHSSGAYLIGPASKTVRNCFSESQTHCALPSFELDERPLATHSNSKSMSAAANPDE